MKNFRINSPDDPEPASESKSYLPGTHFKFENIGGHIKAVLSIQVQFA